MNSTSFVDCANMACDYELQYHNTCTITVRAGPGANQC